MRSTRRRVLLALLFVPVLCAGLCSDSNDDVFDQRLVGFCCAASIEEPARYDWVGGDQTMDEDDFGNTLIVEREACISPADLDGGSGDFKSVCRDAGFLGCECDDGEWVGFCDFEDDDLDGSCVCTSAEGCDG